MSLLWERIVSVSERALREGALVSLPTEEEVMADGGIPFVVHTSRLPERKARAKREQRAQGSNPFLPPDPELVVGSLPTGHVAVLNKFNVLDHHLLIVTGGFEAQDELLTVADLGALLTCMAEVEGLGFYNGGRVAGASQDHKHLQLAPLPLGPGPLPVPLDAVIPDDLPPGRIATVAALPFAHALVPLDGAGIAGLGADDAHRIYRRACAAVGVVDRNRPYNMLLTRSWMLVVPRSRERWQGVSINALGFAGSFLVRSRGERDELRIAGPVRVLASVVDEGAAS